MMDKSRQCGGNPLLALPALADLAIPIGLTMASYYTHKCFKNKQTGGGRFGGTGKVNRIGLPANIIDNSVLHSYLNGKPVAPNTLIPTNTLLSVLNTHLNQKNINKSSIESQLHNFVSKEDLEKYKKKKHLMSIKSETKIPFAIIMGPSVFNQYVDEIFEKMK